MGEELGIAVSSRSLRRLLSRISCVAKIPVDSTNASLSFGFRVSNVGSGIQLPLIFLVICRCSQCRTMWHTALKLADTLGTAAHCSERLQGIRALGGEAWANLPAQSMEYGLQQNTLGLVDEDPGVFGAAWQLATSTIHARHGIERAFQWKFGELAFAHDRPGGPCSTVASRTPCSLFAGTAWVTAQANHLFGNTTEGMANATVLQAAEAGSNATKPGDHSAVTSIDGIGGWVTSMLDDSEELQLRLLVTAFSPKHKTSDGDPVTASVSFKRPERWTKLAKTSNSPGSNATLHETRPNVQIDDEPSTQLQLQIRTATLDRSSSPFDAIWRDGYANGWLTNASDRNVYPLSKSVRTMLTNAGKYALVQEKGADYLQMQRKTFAPTDWRDASPAVARGGGTGGETAVVKCGSDPHGDCSVTLTMAPPSVCALWVRLKQPRSRIPVSCLAALRASCTTNREKPHNPAASNACAICAGHSQHKLKENGCTNADIAHYCAQIAVLAHDG